MASSSYLTKNIIRSRSLRAFSEAGWDRLRAQKRGRQQVYTLDGLEVGCDGIAVLADGNVVVSVLGGLR